MEELPLSMLYLQVAGFFITLFFCALFALLETSVTALRLFKLKELENSTNGYKQLFKTLEEHPQHILFTILIANSLTNVTCTALITSVMQNVFMRWHLSEGLGLSLGIAIATMAIVIFGEIIPKNIARVYGDRMLRYTLWITNAVYFLLHPFVNVVTKLIDIIMVKFGKKSYVDQLPTENEIRFLIDYINEKGLMDQHKTAMLQSIFRLSRTPVKEIMIPETEIISVSSNTTIQEAVATFIKYRFSRLPVFDEKHDNIIGIIYQKDIFFLSKDEPPTKIVKEFIRPIIFVPDSMKVNQLLRQFKQEKMHMAIVLNEYGGVDGLVTLEDVLEEIVGPIVDEHELIIEPVIPLKEGGWLINASIPLEDLHELLKIKFEAEESLTLGGFLTEQLQHLPQKGESISYGGYLFQVHKANPKRVLQVYIVPEQTV